MVRTGRNKQPSLCKRAKAMLFWLFLGTFGGHYFYTGRIFGGLLVLVLYWPAEIAYYGIFGRAVAAVMRLVNLVIFWKLGLDAIRIMRGRFKDRQGRLLLNWW